MADLNAIPPQPDAADLAKLSIGADNKASGPNPAAASFKPASNFDWAEEATTPTAASGKAAEPSSTTAADAEDKPQVDGATFFMNGSSGLDEPEFDVSVKLADLQANPDNPLYSATSFAQLNLRPEITEALSAHNFISPSKIQARALPLLLANPPTNMIGQSQSGTGKTAAFAINILSRVDLADPKPQGLVLAPTRELARQISAVFMMMGCHLVELGLKVAEAIPDETKKGQRLEGHIVVGTPGTVIDMLRRRLIDASHLKVLTLDEADQMLETQSMGEQCKRVKQAVPRNIQIVLFSATFPEHMMNFANSFAPGANVLTLELAKLTVKGIKQMYLDCSSDEEKYEALVKFYGLMAISSSIIFVRTRASAEVIKQRMTAEGHSVALLTGELTPDARDEVFNAFRLGKAKVLVATNLLARGIDVHTVSMVVNYDIPETVNRQPDFETYLHRIGRTGRFGHTGAALSFVHNRQSWQNLMAICKHFGVEPTKLDPTDWDAVEKLLKDVMKNKRRIDEAAARAEIQE